MPSPPNPAEMPHLARRGDPAAIAFLLNRALHTKGITVQVKRQNTALLIQLVSESVPAAKPTVRWLYRHLERLQPQGIEQVQIQAKQAPRQPPAWQQAITLPPQTSPQISPQTSPPKASPPKTSPLKADSPANRPAENPNPGVLNPFDEMSSSGISGPTTAQSEPANPFDEVPAPEGNISSDPGVTQDPLSTPLDKRASPLPSPTPSQLFPDSSSESLLAKSSPSEQQAFAEPPVLEDNKDKTSYGSYRNRYEARIEASAYRPPLSNFWWDWTLIGIQANILPVGLTLVMLVVLAVTQQSLFQQRPTVVLTTAWGIAMPVVCILIGNGQAKLLKPYLQSAADVWRWLTIFGLAIAITGIFLTPRFYDASPNLNDGGYLMWLGLPGLILGTLQSLVLFTTQPKIGGWRWIINSTVTAFIVNILMQGFMAEIGLDAGDGPFTIALILIFLLMGLLLYIGCMGSTMQGILGRRERVP